MTRGLVALGLTVSAAMAQQAPQTSGPDGEVRLAPVDEKMTNGFNAVAFLTSDADWEEKWSAANGTLPTLTLAQRLDVGDTGTILVFFRDPGLRQGLALVECALRLERPDGEIQEVPAYPCFRGPLLGPQSDVRRAELAVNFKVEPTDPDGIWQADITVRDVARDAEANLTLIFEVNSAEAE